VITGFVDGSDLANLTDMQDDLAATLADLKAE
jgi:hypothetical protein